MNPLQIQKSKKNEDENYISSLHHALMKTYGWIPFTEFQDLDIPTITNLIERINQDIEAEKAAYEKARKKHKK